MKAYLAIFLILAFASCRQIYPLQIGGGYRIDYDSRSILTLMDSNNTILSDCFVDGYYRDSDIVLVRCRDKKAVAWDSKSQLHLSSKFHLHFVGDHLYEYAMDSVLVFGRLHEMGKENIQITPLP